MPNDFETKKRKGSVPERDAEKVKKVKKVKNMVTDAAGIPAMKRKATEDAAPIKAKKPKAPTESTTNEGHFSKQVEKLKTPKPIIKGASDSKPAKKIEQSNKLAEEDAKAAKSSESIDGDKSISKKHRVSQEKTEAKTNGMQTADKNEDEQDDDSDDEIDDQTAALLKGFESDGDENDKINEGYSDGDAIPTIEANDKLSKKKKKALKKAAASPSQGKPGVVYIGRIPHGFYENEMKAYFSQFGNILQLRLSRNKKTGASRHYAFIQFESAAVADIVAKTMDNYLMFGHILKVKLVPEDQVPANVFKGANKRFKKVPWNKMQGRKLEQGASEQVWDARADKEQKRRDEKAEKLKEIGYEFDSPKIKSAKTALELPDADGEMKAIEAAPVTEESSKPNKKKKKTKTVKEVEGSASKEPSEPANGKTSVATKPSKEDIEESIAALIAETTEKPRKKEKKDKSKETLTSAMPDSEEVKPVKVTPMSEPSSKPKKDKKKEKAKIIAE